MSYTQLSVLTEMLSEKQLAAVELFFSNHSANSKISASRFALATAVDFSLANKILKVLVDYPRQVRSTHYLTRFFYRTKS